MTKEEIESMYEESKKNIKLENPEERKKRKERLTGHW